jgi:DNA primase
MRGPTYRGFSAGGSKSLFRLPGSSSRLNRVAVCEAAIDALSLAAMECLRADTLYTATAGGLGPVTIAALQQLLQGLAAEPAGLLIAATDADSAGRRYALRLQHLAMAAGVSFDAILPPDGCNDWNDALRNVSAP